MEFFNNHKKLFITAFLLFLVLTIFVCIMPAINNQNNNAPLPNAIALSDDAIKGKAIFIKEGCVACHTQQVRNVAMDKMWGSRPSIAADYAANYRIDVWRNTATLMGTERTGPDLTNIGLRQPSQAWHLTHLYNPRIVVKESIMPSYKWLFTTKDFVLKTDVVVNVPNEYLDGGTRKVVATDEALQLVAYLQSLQQTKLPDGTPQPAFLYKKPIKISENIDSTNPNLDGEALYVTHCQACHQANGEGLKGAFPPLKGSKIVLNDNPELMVDIIMNGYAARVKEGYAVMAAVGTNNNLTADEVAAIMNHEKTNWGNNAKKVTPAEVKKLMDFVKINAKPL